MKDVNHGKLRVGIVTIQDINFGNRLQNFALQQLLNDMGYIVETLYDISESCFIQKTKGLIKRFLNYDTINMKIKNKLYSKERKEIFSVWNTQFVKYSKIVFSRYYVPKNLYLQYDYFIAGSDQVWNPYFRKDTLFLLSFAKKEQKIGYAASFGVSEIPQEYKNKFKKYLSDFKAISVREHAGSKIIFDLIGIEPIIIIDPTMMLTKEQWITYEKMPYWFLNERYILTYSLGGLPKNVRAFVEYQANKNSLKIIELLKPDNRDWYLVNPFEFIYLIHHADLIVTDSFHGSIFSILMERPFLVFERVDFNKTMNSRLETLLSTFKLQKHIFRENFDYKQVFDTNYNHINNILLSERQKARMFIKQNLD